MGGQYDEICGDTTEIKTTGQGINPNCRVVIHGILKHIKCVLECFR